MTQERRSLYAKELGRSQRAASMLEGGWLFIKLDLGPPTVDPSANSEDQLARYQVKRVHLCHIHFIEICQVIVLRVRFKFQIHD